MNDTVGNRPTLKQAVAWLRDDARRHARIMDVVERNSVIEGLPPFSPAMRSRIAEELLRIAAEQQSALNESPPSSAGNPV